MMFAETTDAPRLRPLLRGEYEQLIELGCFEDERLELLNGFLVRMSPQNAPHSITIKKLTKLLVRRCGDLADVRIQLPLATSVDSEPEPDVALTEPSDAIEQPSDAFLVIEVADASLKHDRDLKGPIYAAAGYPEYWIVNLPERCVEVYRDPAAGRYRTVTTARPGDRLRLSALPDIELLVDEILP